MCCIFTCCGWMIDLIQRLWVFLMSCCMCSAVCISVMTASMSGIAMGYNYSLAEYIDMKETNVSVFLKRGIFDDDLGADMGFRRAGHGPVSGLIKEADLVTAEPEELEVPDRSGRRLDDSVLQSNDNSNFEGSLMKLTAKPPAATEPPPTFRGDEGMGEVMKKYPSDSLEQLKAIQNLINMRRVNQNRATVDYDKTTQSNRRENFVLGRRMNYDRNAEIPERRQLYVDKAAIPIEHMIPNRNHERDKVPDRNIGASENWLLPKGLEETLGRTLFFTDEYDNLPPVSHTYPFPIRYKTDVPRPTLTATPETQRTTALFGPDEVPKEVIERRRLENSDVRVKDKLLMDKSMFPSFRRIDNGKSDSQEKERSEEVDYEEEAKQGIRVRKKRNTNISPKEVIVDDTHYSLSHLLFIIDDSKGSENATNNEFVKNITNDIKNVTLNGIGEEYIGNKTQYMVFATKNETGLIDKTINSSTTDWTMSFDLHNYSIPTTDEIKPNKSILIFLKSLLN